MKSTFISGFGDRYRIFENGEVENVHTGRRLRGSRDKISGYRTITLSLDGKRHDYLLHRLVAISFIPNPKHLPQVNHLDGNKENNCISNLEWVTDRENKYHAFQNNLSGLDDWVKVLREDNQVVYDSITSAAKSVGGTQPGLSIALKENRPYKGANFSILEGGIAGDVIGRN